MFNSFLFYCMFSSIFFLNLFKCTISDAQYCTTIRPFVRLFVQMVICKGHMKLHNQIETSAHQFNEIAEENMISVSKYYLVCSHRHLKKKKMNKWSKTCRQDIFFIIVFGRRLGIAFLN